MNRIAGMFRKPEDGLAEKLIADLAACGLPSESPYSIKEMAQVMRKDKKAEGGNVHFVLPKAIGSVEVVDLTVDEVVKLLK